MNLAALSPSKSFCYLTRNDFISAYGKEQTVLIAKDYKQIKVNFESNNQETNSLLLSRLAYAPKEAELQDVHIIGDVLRPTQLKLVNTEARQTNDSCLLFCLDNIPSDDDHEPEAKTSSGVETTDVKEKRQKTSRSKQLNLFRRRLKPKSFMDLDESEREQFASKVLERNNFKDKSLFHFINEKQLVSSLDYSEPNFITLDQPPDSEYEENYSSIAPNIHDLFDFYVEPLENFYELEEPEDYAMVEEYLEDYQDDT